MAKRDITIYESDLSGDTGASTTTIGLKGSWYEIDLTEDEQKELEGVLARYLEVSRKTARVGGTGRATGPKTTREERDAIRAWANKNGYEVEDRGRIANNIILAYREAHGIERTD